MRVLIEFRMRDAIHVIECSTGGIVDFDRKCYASFGEMKAL